MSDDKCKGCQWHNKPYWSIINPCDNCPRENTNVEIIARWEDPTIEELKKEIKRLNNKNEELLTLYTTEREVKDYYKNIINELKKWLEEDLKQVYRDAGYRHNLILEVLDKLQELKGSDKE